MTSLKRCNKRGASKESIAQKGLRPLDGGRTKKAPENMFFARSEDLSNCLLYTLHQCPYSNKIGITVTDADALENKFTSFETIMTAHVFRKIFANTDLASNILQSEKIDLFIAVRLVETAEGRLRQLRSDFTKVFAETEEFCSRHNLVIFQHNVSGKGRRRVTSSPMAKLKKIKGETAFGSNGKKGQGPCEGELYYSNKIY